MSDLTGDARFALRTLVRRPGATLLLVATLALGLAANAVIFNVLDAVVLRAFAFPNLERLVRVHETSRDFEGIDLSNVAPANLLDWQAQTGGVFSDLVGLHWWDASLRGRDAAERVQGYRVGPSFFAALGVAPAQGRGFLAEEAREGRDRRAVLGHALWQRAFGAEPVVGKTVIVDSEPFTVVGIAPPGFQFPEGAELWAPLVLPDPATAARDRHYLSVMGKLARGRTREEARVALAVVAARLSREHPKTNASRGVAVPSFRAGFADPVLPQILVIWQAAAVLVLLIACVNVANLILARSAERGREPRARLDAARRRGVRAARARGGRRAAGLRGAPRGLDPGPARARHRPGPGAARGVARRSARAAASPDKAIDPRGQALLGLAPPAHKEVALDTLVALWLPILVSAVLVFVASSLIWNVLGAHKWHVKGLPDEAAAREALSKQAVAPGQYSIPYCPDPAMMKDPAFKEKLEKGPVAVLMVRKPGLPNMGVFLGCWFLHLLFVSWFVGLVCGQTLHRGAPYMLVFRVAAAVAFAGYSFAHVPNAIWWGRPWKSAFKEVADGLVYALLTAGTFGWLWPR